MAQLPIKIEDIMQDYKSEAYNLILAGDEQLKQEFKERIDYMRKRLEGQVEGRVIGYQDVRDYVESNTRDLINIFLKREMEKYQEAFMAAQKHAMVELEEIAIQKCESDELDSKLRGTVNRFGYSLDLPNCNFINAYMSEFASTFLTKYHLKGTELQRFVSRQVEDCSYELEEMYRKHIDKRNDELTERLGRRTPDIKGELVKQEESLDKVEENNFSSMFLDDSEPTIATSGKSQEELAHEKEIALQKMYGDPTLTPEQKSAMYDEIANKYDNAIENSKGSSAFQIDTSFIL